MERDGQSLIVSVASAVETTMWYNDDRAKRRRILAVQCCEHFSQLAQDYSILSPADSLAVSALTCAFGLAVKTKGTILWMTWLSRRLSESLPVR